MIPLTLEFGGGVEVLFNNKKQLKIEVDNENDKGFTVALLLKWILENLLKSCDRLDFFIVDGNIRPGILVLVNDTDWEILGEQNATLKANDTVTFISTLHGG